ncbi:MAG TPA: GNAT family N-acetyltransferase [Opitutales bacterium]|nr:GNAT family N-acetyltransferase [Opitutales bacterium]
MLEIEVCRTFSMPPEKRREVLDMCNAAFGQPFEALFDILPPDGTHLLGREDGRLVAHLVITDRWMRPEGGPTLRVAYIDALATDADFRHRGHAGLLLKTASDLCAVRYDVLALSTDLPDLYARYGFVKWHGRLLLEKETGTGTDFSPEQGKLMIRVSNMSLIPDFTKSMTANWRPGGGF